MYNWYHVTCLLNGCKRREKENMELKFFSQINVKNKEKKKKIP